MKDYIRFTPGGENYIVFTKNILFIKESSIGCEIHVIELEEPFFVNMPFAQLLKD